jgi:hypothetical protein
MGHLIVYTPAEPGYRAANDHPFLCEKGRGMTDLGTLGGNLVGESEREFRRRFERHGDR